MDSKTKIRRVTQRFEELTVLQFSVLKDNYNFLIYSEQTQQVALVDPSLAEPALQILHEQQWQLTDIFNTHHHWDHTDGNIEIQKLTGCNVIGYRDDAARIPAINLLIDDTDQLYWGGEAIRILFLPGHTTAHIAYYFPRQGILFSGDVIFAMGCGRLFEGTAQQAFHSLQQIAALPEETVIFCAHEYTETNGRFALEVEPSNQALIERMQHVRDHRQQNHFTVPTTVAYEKQTNPFLRCHSHEIREQLGLPQNTHEVDVFAALRERRNHFQ